MTEQEVIDELKEILGGFHSEDRSSIVVALKAALKAVEFLSGWRNIPLCPICEKPLQFSGYSGTYWCGTLGHNKRYQVETKTLYKVQEQP